MPELVALAEDRELLTPLRAAALAEIQIQRAPVDAHHQPLERIERLDEMLRHEPEGRSDTVRHAGDSARDACEHAEDDEAADRPDPRAQNATEGWCTPKTPRSRSQISPSVTPTSTAMTRSGRRFSRARATRSASAGPTAASTWKRFPCGSSSVTNSLTPTTIRACSSTSCW